MSGIEQTSMITTSPSDIPGELLGDEMTGNLLEFKLPNEAFVYFLIRESRVIYVGQTINIDSRIRDHRSMSGMNFDRILILRCERSVLNEVESYWLNKLQPPYNVSGTNNPRGCPEDAIERKVNADRARARLLEIERSEGSSNTIASLALPRRYKTAMIGKGIELIDQLCELTEIQVLETRNCGVDCLEHFTHALGKIGRTLKKVGG